LAVSALVAALFMGGWNGPGIAALTVSAPFWASVLGFVYFLLKMGAVIFVLMWFRGTLPRFRIDQLLDFGWKFLTPLALVNLLVVAFVVKLFQPGTSAGVQIAAGPLAGWGGPGQSVFLLVSSILVAFLASLVVRAFARRSKDMGLRAISAMEN